MHVLVVEDDQDARELLYLMLSEAGYKVSQAKGVSDAMRLFRLHPDIAVVVTDMHLGHRLNGLQMIGEMRQQLGHIHFILSSGDWDSLEAACAGGTTILRKPYGRLELLHAVVDGIAACAEQRTIVRPRRMTRRGALTITL